MKLIQIYEKAVSLLQKGSDIQLLIIRLILAYGFFLTMIVAILSVHLGNGFEAGNNGFEIPLYYIIMLLTLIVFGPGRFSLDHVLKNYLSSKKEK